MDGLTCPGSDISSWNPVCESGAQDGVKFVTIPGRASVKLAGQTQRTAMGGLVLDGSGNGIIDDLEECSAT